MATAVEMTEMFWVANSTKPERPELFAAAIHALFLARNPRHLQFEEFVLLYMAFDACFALATSMHPPNARVTHGPTTDYTLTSGYVGFLLPLMVEVQHLARHTRA